MFRKYKLKLGKINYLKINKKESIKIILNYFKGLLLAKKMGPIN